MKNIEILETNIDIYNDIAFRMACKLIENNKRGVKTSFILPVGPKGQYIRFAHICNDRNISCRNLVTIAMDDFLDDNNELFQEEHKYFSFRGFLKRNLFDQFKKDIAPDPNNFHYPDPKDTGQTLELLNELGGADICFLGVGINGHIAFNEPPEEIITLQQFKKTGARILNLSLETRIMTSLKYGGYIEKVPKKCITTGLKEILLSKEVRIYMEHNHQAAALLKFIFSVPTADFPVTSVKEHTNYHLTISSNVLEAYRQIL